LGMMKEGAVLASRRWTQWVVMLTVRNNGCMSNIKSDRTEAREVIP